MDIEGITILYKISIGYTLGIVARSLAPHYNFPPPTPPNPHHQIPQPIQPQQSIILINSHTRQKKIQQTSNEAAPEFIMSKDVSPMRNEGF